MVSPRIAFIALTTAFIIAVAFAAVTTSRHLAGSHHAKSAKPVALNQLQLLV
jgi:hypothetical protein